jgi:hypothetical protein
MTSAIAGRIVSSLALVFTLARPANFAVSPFLALMMYVYDCAESVVGIVLSVKGCDCQILH